LAIWGAISRAVDPALKACACAPPAHSVANASAAKTVFFMTSPAQFLLRAE